jgi:hypothetical protein
MYCIGFAASLLARYLSWTSSHTAKDFSPRTVNNLSPCGKFNAIDAKHKQKSAIHPVQELGIVYTLVGGFTAQREIFTIRGEKSLAVRELVQDTYRARREAANPIHF